MADSKTPLTDVFMDSVRLDWILEQNRLGKQMQFVTSREDIDDLMETTIQESDRG